MDIRRFGKALSVCAAAAMLSACALRGGMPPLAAPGAMPQTPGSNAKERSFLYVAGSTSPSRGMFTDRFRLVQGIPAAHPDRVYNGYGGSIAVTGDGTLYAVGPLQVIAAFAPGSDKPSREIDVAPRCGPSVFTLIGPIAADENGYLFVWIYTYDGPSASHRLRADPDTRTPCNGVAVYAPNASGYAHPVQAIRFSQGFGSAGLAVDRNDNLYLGQNYPADVKEYSSAIVHPKLTRTITGKYLGTVRSLATDSAGDVYIANAAQSFSLGWIDRYAPTAKGDGPPTSTIYIEAPPPHLLYSITAHGHYLYASDSNSSVELYHARRNGKQSPADSLAVSNVSSVAVGP